MTAIPNFGSINSPFQSPQSLGFQRNNYPNNQNLYASPKGIGDSLNIIEKPFDNLSSLQNDPYKRNSNFQRGDNSPSIAQRQLVGEKNYESLQRRNAENEYSGGDFANEKGRRNLQDNAKGSLWDNVGDNNRHKNLLNDFQEYMKNNPLKPYTKKRQGREVEREETQKSKEDPFARNVNPNKTNSGDWYVQNFNVGALPGMGKVAQRPRQRGHEINNMEDKYVNEAIERSRRPSDNPRPNGSRLAGIGSIILDSEGPQYENQRSFTKKSEQIPRELDNFSSANNQRDILNDIQNFRTPQLLAEREQMRFNFATPQNTRPQGNYESNIERKIPSFKDIGDDKGFQGNYNSENGPSRVSYHVKAQRVFKEERQPESVWQDQGNQNRRVESYSREMQAGVQTVVQNSFVVDWVSERQKQEEEKKIKQKEELQRIYREQIEEKKRRKEEEQRRQMLEEQKEEERLRKENEELQKQYLQEQQQKKGGSDAKNNNPAKAEESLEESSTKRRPNQQKNEQMWKNYAKKFESPEIKIDKDDPDVKMIEDMIAGASKKMKGTGVVIERPKFEFRADQEVKVHPEVNRLNAALDEQLDRMRKDIDYHAKVIQNELSNYKKQANLSEGLRQNAQNQLFQLKEDFKLQKLDAEGKIYESPSLSQERSNAFNKKAGIAKVDEKIGLRVPNKAYVKTYIPEEEGQDLGSTPGITLKYDTHYIPVINGVVSPKIFKEKPNINDILHKYDIEDKNEDVNALNKDAAKQKFSQLFPSHANNTKVNSKDGYKNSTRNPSQHDRLDDIREVDGNIARGGMNEGSDGGYEGGYEGQPEYDQDYYEEDHELGDQDNY